jgi:nitrile hydratase
MDSKKRALKENLSEESDSTVHDHAKRNKSEQTSHSNELVADSKESAGKLGIHDVGGRIEEFQPLDLTDVKYQYWERRVHALLVLLIKKNVITVDELRRGIEAIEPKVHVKMRYYEKWTASMLSLAMEKKLFKNTEFEEKLGISQVDSGVLYKVGDVVRVKAEDIGTAWRKPHLRTPGYIHGSTGTIERICGIFQNPSHLAFGEKGDVQPLYRVRFLQKAIWLNREDEHDGKGNDTIDVEIYQHWLEPGSEEDLNANRSYAAKKSHDHDSHADHDHHHDERLIVEQNAVNSEGLPSEYEAISAILITLLIEKGVFTSAEINACIEAVDMLGKKAEGARLVARAWIDPDFKARLLSDASSAAQELGIKTSNYSSDPASASLARSTSFPDGHTVLTVVENTPQVHNLIVCTLCSCYPAAILGLSPDWYKSRSYRSRAVIEPRKLLEEFGLHIPKEKTVRVHDSTADLRYMVLPERPKNTESFSEDELIALVTRDSLIGVGVPLEPGKIN